MKLLGSSRPLLKLQSDNGEIAQGGEDAARRTRLGVENLAISHARPICRHGRDWADLVAFVRKKEKIMTYNDTDSERALARRFFTEYDKVVDENARLRADNDSYKHENAALVAEVNMLREELERSDRDRMRLQGFSSTLVARLTVIRETIENAAREAIRQSIPEKLPETPIITEQQISEQQQHDKLQEIVNKLPRIDMN